MGKCCTVDSGPTALCVANEPRQQPLFDSSVINSLAFNNLSLLYCKSRAQLKLTPLFSVDLLLRYKITGCIYLKAITFEQYFVN